MATKKHTPIKAHVSKEVLEKRVRELLSSFFKAQGIVQSVVAAMRDRPGDQIGFRYALEAADDMLRDIGGELDPAVLLDPDSEQEGSTLLAAGKRYQIRGANHG